MFCSKCGKELTGKERFCPRCGNALADSGLNHTQKSIVKTQKKNTELTRGVSVNRDKKKPWGIVMCSIAIIIAAATVVAFLLFNSGYEYLAVVTNGDGMTGCINEKDEMVIECKYDALFLNADEGHAIVWEKKEGTTDENEYNKGVLDTEGEVIIPIQYAEVENLNVDGEIVFALAEKAGTDEEGDPVLNWGFADSQGNMLTEFKYQYSELRKSYYTNEIQGVVYVSSYVQNDSDEGYLYGAINNKGEEVIPLDSQYISPWDSIGNSGLLAIQRRDAGQEWKAGYVNYHNEVVIPFEYDNARNFMSNGLAAVENNGKWGYIDLDGNLVVPYRYDNAYDFSENGLARVQLGDSTIYINENGDEMIQGNWDFANDFDENGFAQVYDENRNGLIDENGNEVLSCSYDTIYTMNDFYMAKSQNICRIIDKDGQHVYGELENLLRDDYDYISGIGDNGWVSAGVLSGQVEKRNTYEWSYIDENGNVRLILSEKYNNASPLEKINDSES